MKNQSSKNKTILVVEDELSTLEALVEIFTIEGFNVLEAKNGKEGLEVALKKHPDLILLDIIMPKMDGMAMLRQLRKDNWGKRAKVIILTNLSAVERTTEALDSRVYDYFVKANWKITDLVEKVKEKLKVK